MPSTTCLLLLMYGFLAQVLTISTAENNTGGSGGVTFSQIKELAIKMANNGLEKGEQCDYDASTQAFFLLTVYGGRSVEDLMAKREFLEPDLPDDAKSLDPSKYDIVCAAKKGLYCSYDPVDNVNTCQICEEIRKASIDAEACPVVFKKIKNAKEYNV